MVGATLAHALANTPFSIALVDATPHAPVNDPRLIALTSQSVCLFKNLGLWTMMAPHAAPIKKLHVSHRGQFGISRMHANDFKLDALGYVVPAKYINAALYETLATLKNITLIRPEKLSAIQQDQHRAELTLSTKKINTRLVIAADGTHSTLRALLNIPTEIIPYGQKALVTITELQRHHQHIAYERFHQHGAVAMLPLTETSVATIWTDQESTVDALLQLSDTEFLATLQKQFGYRLGRLQATKERHVFPLQFIRAKETQKGKVLLIGNAAHTLHPIASQGLNLALYEIAALAEHFATQTPDTLAFPDMLPYDNQQQASIQLSHRLTQLFSTDMRIVQTARQLGMIGFELFPSIKEYFAALSMGRNGHVPELMSTISLTSKR